MRPEEARGCERRGTGGDPEGCQGTLGSEGTGKEQPGQAKSEASRALCRVCRWRLEVCVRCLGSRQTRGISAEVGGRDQSKDAERWPPRRRGRMTGDGLVQSDPMAKVWGQRAWVREQVTCVCRRRGGDLEQRSGLCSDRETGRREQAVRLWCGLPTLGLALVGGCDAGGWQEGSQDGLCRPVGPDAAGGPDVLLRCPGGVQCTGHC